MAKMIADYEQMLTFKRQLLKLADDLKKAKYEADTSIKHMSKFYNDETFIRFKEQYEEGMKRIPKTIKNMQDFAIALQRLAEKVKKHLSTHFRRRF